MWVPSQCAAALQCSRSEVGAAPAHKHASPVCLTPQNNHASCSTPAHKSCGHKAAQKLAAQQQTHSRVRHATANIAGQLVKRTQQGSRPGSVRVGGKAGTGQGSAATVLWATTAVSIVTKGTKENCEKANSDAVALAGLSCTQKDYTTQTSRLHGPGRRCTQKRKSPPASLHNSTRRGRGRGRVPSKGHLCKSKGDRAPCLCQGAADHIHGIQSNNTIEQAGQGNICCRTVSACVRPPQRHTHRSLGSDNGQGNRQHAQLTRTSGWSDRPRVHVASAQGCGQYGARKPLTPCMQGHINHRSSSECQRV